MYRTSRDSDTFLQKLLRTIAEMQKDFDNVVLENQRKERLHAVPDDTASRGGDFSLGSRSGAGSGADFMNIDSATPLLKEQQRVQVLRVGGKEVVQHDVAAVEAVRTRLLPCALDSVSFCLLPTLFSLFSFAAISARAAERLLAAGK